MIDRNSTQIPSVTSKATDNSGPVFLNNNRSPNSVNLAPKLRQQPVHETNLDEIMSTVSQDVSFHFKGIERLIFCFFGSLQIELSGRMSDKEIGLPIILFILFLGGEQTSSINFERLNFFFALLLFQNYQSIFVQFHFLPLWLIVGHFF